MNASRSYAAHRALVDLFPSQIAMFDALMLEIRAQSVGAVREPGHARGCGEPRVCGGARVPARRRGEPAWRSQQRATAYSGLQTPPFAEYTSGHSAVSAAAATVLRLFTGSSRLGASYTSAAGSSRIEPGVGEAAS